MKSRFCLVLLICLNFAPQPLPAQSDRSKITKANYDRVRGGMTIDEVRELLGRPFDILTQAAPAAVDDGQREKLETWIYQRRAVLVTIGFRNGYVINKWWNADGATVAAENEDR